MKAVTNGQQVASVLQRYVEVDGARRECRRKGDVQGRVTRFTFDLHLVLQYVYYRPVRLTCHVLQGASAHVALLFLRPADHDAPNDAPMVEDAPAKAPARKRPKLDLAAALGGGARGPKRGVMGLLVGTLNKAKIEDKERSASEAVR
jgi:hypothetical protein